MKTTKFSIADRLKSFVFAFEGIAAFFKKEHNAWIHLAASGIVIFLAIVLKISAMEWIAICFAIGLVWITEMLNTCVEKMLDFMSTEINPKIKLIKDIAAGAVLVAAIVALVIGAIVFFPYINI